jgi:hypothetical protein
MSKHKYFSSDIVFNQSFEQIDTEKGIIKGVKVCSEGEAKGHGVQLNKNFIREVTRLGKEHGPGIKARFGHPNMCATSLGTYIGRYKNYRTNIETTQEGTRHHSIADLHLDETAKNLPKIGNAWDYIFKLAQTSPDMFGNSIVFTPGESEYETIENQDGSKSQVEYATIESLHATDLVDDPAATDGLFSKFSDDDMAAQVTMFLDQHTEVYELAASHPEIVEEFLRKYELHKNHKNMTEIEVKTFGEKLDTLLEKVTAFFKPAEIPEETTAKTDLEIANEKITAFENQIAEHTAANEAEKAELGTLKSLLLAKQAEAENLVTELKAMKNEWVPEGRTNNTGLPEITGVDKSAVKELRNKSKIK